MFHNRTYRATRTNMYESADYRGLSPIARTAFDNLIRVVDNHGRCPWLPSTLSELVLPGLPDGEAWLRIGIAELCMPKAVRQSSYEYFSLVEMASKSQVIHRQNTGYEGYPQDKSALYHAAEELTKNAVAHSSITSKRVDQTPTAIYIHADRKYLCLTAFIRHNKIQKPGKSLYPAINDAGSHVIAGIWYENELTQWTKPQAHTDNVRQLRAK